MTHGFVYKDKCPGGKELEGFCVRVIEAPCEFEIEEAVEDGMDVWFGDDRVELPESIRFAIRTAIRKLLGANTKDAQ